MIDLHLHSMFSDGTFTPEELVAQAVQLGLTAIALTDHDTMAGLPRFLEAGAKADLRTVPGVEISTTYAGRNMHLLGYFVDPGDAALNEELNRMRTARAERNERILGRLERLGLPVRAEDVAASAGGDVLGRPHIAQALVAQGYVASKEEAFEKYLGVGCAGYVSRPLLQTPDAIAAIRRAGGVAVVAHPVSLKLPPAALRSLLQELQAVGLGGVETYYPEHSRPLTLLCRALAEDVGLAVTGGSDFHGAASPRIRMGYGLGDLAVPDELLDQLAARRPAIGGRSS